MTEEEHSVWFEYHEVSEEVSVLEGEEWGEILV
jgi:hypothetical protein